MSDADVRQKIVDAIRSAYVPQAVRLDHADSIDAALEDAADAILAIFATSKWPPKPDPDLVFRTYWYDPIGVPARDPKESSDD